MTGVSGNIYNDKETFFNDSMHKGMNDADLQYGKDFEKELREQGFIDAADKVAVVIEHKEVTSEDKVVINDAIMGQFVPELSGNIHADLETFITNAKDHQGQMDAGDIKYGTALVQELKEQGYERTASRIEGLLSNRTLPTDISITINEDMNADFFANQPDNSLNFDSGLPSGDEVVVPAGTEKRL
jgi:hypothetical protein